MRLSTQGLKITDSLRELRSGLHLYDRELWHILTALRGPDFQTVYLLPNDEDAATSLDTLKQATTAVIRHAVFGYIACADSHADSAYYAEFRKAFRYVYSSNPLHHFITHAQKAFEALGLKWDEVNED